MATFYSIDEANERLPEIAEALLVLRDQRRELIRLRDRYVELTGHPIDESDLLHGAPGSGDPQRRADASAEVDGATLTGLEEPRLITLRVRGIVDQMGASVARLDRWGIALRDIETGLVDFPALIEGRAAWLCWRLDEPQRIAWWHEHDTGIAGRRRLEELGTDQIS